MRTFATIAGAVAASIVVIAVLNRIPMSGSTVGAKILVG